MDELLAIRERRVVVGDQVSRGCPVRQVRSKTAERVGVWTECEFAYQFSLSTSFAALREQALVQESRRGAAARRRVDHAGV